MRDMREQDIKALFHSGNRRDADDFDRALREAKSAKSRAAVFSFAGRELIVMQNLDNGAWSYRPTSERK